MAICRGGCGGSCDSDHSAQSIFCFGLACKERPHQHLHCNTGPWRQKFTTILSTKEMPVIVAAPTKLSVRLVTLP